MWIIHVGSCWGFQSSMGICCVCVCACVRGEVYQRIERDLPKDKGQGLVWMNPWHLWMAKHVTTGVVVMDVSYTCDFIVFCKDTSDGNLDNFPNCCKRTCSSSFFQEIASDCRGSQDATCSRCQAWFRAWSSSSAWSQPIGGHGTMTSHQKVCSLYS